MIVLASAFGTFVLFLFLGLLALPITAALDKLLGKEKALLVYAGVLLAFTVFVLAPSGPGTNTPRPGRETVVPAEQLAKAKADAFGRVAPNHEFERNAFLPFSDTRPLPPVTLDAPPWVALEFALPPTVPGPAPGFRRVLRGALPTLTPGDGTAIAPIPDAVFADYEVQPQDVYDWVMNAGRPFYIYIRAIYDGKNWVREDERGFGDLKWTLATNGDGYESLRVRYALVGFEKEAAKYLDRNSVIKRRIMNLTEKAASDEDRWFLRRTVENLYTEALMQHAGGRSLGAKLDPERLRRAAADMAEVGKTGKEGLEGWRRAVELLEAALEEVRRTAGPSVRADYLMALLEAQRALRDEQAELRTLSEYVRTSPTSTEARAWIGQLHLRGMQLPGEALLYFRSALEANARFGPALIGEGDALAFVGDHAQALRSYGRAAGDTEGQLRRAVGELRVARLEEARGTAESVLAREPSSAQALLVRGAALYALGDLESARSAFEQLASLPDAHAVRAQAAYDLGLTCLRLGRHDAALAAFDACERALRQGSSMGPTPDETVSPALGRALVAFAAGDAAKLLTFLDLARREAPRSSYVEMFGGMVASQDGNDTAAVRALDAALRRAPVYAELDGWLGRTYLRLGERALATGAAAADTAETFERAIKFAERAADRETRADKLAFGARLRECLVRVGAAHLPSRQRYTDALAAAEKVLAVSELREQPAALALSGYCNYQLGKYDECMRRLQGVLDVVPDTEEAEWKGWRDYAGAALDAVKHWRSLEEKLVTFKTVNLDRQWEDVQKRGVTLRIEDGKLHFSGEANADGSINDAQVGPTVEVANKDLFARDTFERVTLNLRIPRQDRRGEAVNNVVFGVMVEVAGRRSGSGAKSPGIGVFYDKAKIAVRIGGGQDKQFKEGAMLRLDPEQMWPGDEEIAVRIEREDEEKGTMAVYLNDQLVARDNVSGFKRSRGAAQLWLGGAANQAQKFDVWVSDIRVVRRK